MIFCVPEYRIQVALSLLLRERQPEALLGWIQLDCNKEPVEAFTKEVVKALDSMLPKQ